MIDLTKANVLTDNMKSLHDISLDKSDKTNPQYMTNSLYQATDFDDVKDNYFLSNSFISTKELRSNDALAILDIPKLQFLFIEFKNGRITSTAKKEEIRTKIAESLLIINDLLDKNLTFDRSNINYILVYNKTKNTDFENERNSSKTSIATILAKTAGMSYTIGGFDRYKSFFHDVKTINEDEFQDIVTSLENGTYSF